MATTSKRETRTARRAQRRELAATRDLVADDAALARHGLALVLEAAPRHTGWDAVWRAAAPDAGGATDTPDAGDTPDRPDMPGAADDHPPLTVTLYEATDVEPPTAALTAALHEAGVRVLVPITTADLDLDWCDVADPARTPLGLGGIALADLVLTPGLAVGRDRTRLGQGGGCYDKALPRRREGVPVVTLLHPEELTDDTLPRDSHDHLVDGVLTAAGVTWL